MRITQSSVFVRTLLTHAATGQILPAAMQRPYVWQRKDVEALCDSILSGFPIGSFLLWEPDGAADLSSVAKGRLGPIGANVSTTGSDPYQLMLDGQNRLATLAWLSVEDIDQVILENPHEAELNTWLGDSRLVLDYETRSLKFVPKHLADEGLRLPAWTLVSSKSMSVIRACWDRWTKEMGFTEDQADDVVRFHDQCSTSFRDARTTVTIIERATAAQARSAFLRICNVGVQMSVEDFDKAVGWAPEETAL